jgi:hypothetical protein
MSYVQLKQSEKETPRDVYVDETVPTTDMEGATSSAPLTRRQNRWGTATKKEVSHATSLGYHAKNYVPSAALKEVHDMIAKTKSLGSISSMASVNSIDDETFSRCNTEADLIQMEVHHLKKAGLSLEDITWFVYDHLHDQELPNFIRFVHLDQDGGLDRIHTLWSSQRIFWAVLLVVFVVMNVLYLLESNWSVFRGFATHVLTTRAAQGMEKAIDAASGGPDIFSHIPDIHRRKLILHLASVVGTCEICWVVYKVAHTMNQWRIFRGYCEQSEYRQYRNGVAFFQDSLPVLSTFSLLKFVSFVHPSLIATDYYDMLHQRSWLPGSTLGTVLVSIYFILTRLLMALLSVGAFAMKLLAVGLKLIDPTYNFSGCFIQTGLLMNQCMGAVLFEKVLQDRIFLFIFGGSDTDFREDELALKGVYRCRVAKQIWEEYWAKAKRCEGWKAWVMMMTLDHFDLQRLLLDDDAGEVSEVADKERSRSK